MDAHGLRLRRPGRLPVADHVSGRPWCCWSPGSSCTAGSASLRPQLRGATVVLGLGVFAAYGLTLVALSLVSVSQVPAIAALRESSILFVLALSWLTAQVHCGQTPAHDGHRRRGHPRLRRRRYRARLTC